MKHLILDVGNTLIKCAAFINGKIEWCKQATASDFDIIIHLLNSEEKNTPIIVSAVSDIEIEIIECLKSFSNITFFNQQTPIPLKNMYKSLNTLGTDRLASAIGAYGLCPGKDVLSIDAGTCIKYDFVSNKAEYFGGAISPGLNMRLKALNQFTARLPLCTLRDINFLTGTTTEESILSGVINGTVAEVEGIIDKYKMKHPELFVVITGGDADFLVKRLKYPIFADSNLLLNGLNKVLEYNAK